MSERIGVIDVGGGFRAIYADGVLDRCAADGVTFAAALGVSAGSANLTSFAAHQPRRNYRFYTEFGQRREYASMYNFLRTRSYIGLDYVYSTLSNAGGEFPLDYEAIRDNPMALYIVATDALTGNPVYFDKRDLAQDSYDPLKASSAIPLVCKPYFIAGRPYYDGALADPVPVQKAFDLGCDRVVVILNKPADVPREPGRDPKIARSIRRKYPHAARMMETRAERYNQGVALAKAYEKQGKALLISPDDTCGVGTLTRDVSLLDKLYQKGYADGAAVAAFLQEKT